MSREWKPGDVAMVRWPHFGPTRALFNGATRRWEDADGATFDGDEDELTIRPLVVIDPDSPADCERLAQAWEAQKFADLGSVAMTLAAYRMQAALREFADPKPPNCGASISLDYGEQGSHHACEEPEGHDGPHAGTGLMWTAVQ